MTRWHTEGVYPIVEEAAKKAAVAWLQVPGVATPYLVWCTWIDDALYVVSGTGEQAAPGLATATSVQVTLRGDHGGRVVTWPAAVSVVVPGTPAWDSVAPPLAAKRLNAAGGPVRTAERWAADAVLSRLQPDGEPQAGQALPAESLAAPVQPTPAASATRKPFRLHRVRRP